MDREYAPPWVYAVTPSQVVAERANNWQQFHPEDFCHLCGRRNFSWWVASDLWNRAFANAPPGMTSILCPGCFVGLLGGDGGTWELRLDIAPRNLVDAIASEVQEQYRGALDELQ